MANDVHILCLLPHTTHRLQPLDVGIFGPLGNAFSRRCDEVLQETGEEIPIQDFVKEYWKARTDAFKPETIQKAFKNSGIRPVNPSIFADEDYAPSNPTSTQAYTPSSYPIMPTSLLASRDEGHDVSNDNDLDNPDESDSDDSDDSDDEECPGASPTPALSIGAEMVEPSSPEREEISHSPSTSMSVTAINLPPAPVLTTSHRQAQEVAYINPNWTKRRKLEVTMADRDRLLEENARLRQQLDASTTHCAMAMAKIGDLKRKLNAKENRKSKSTTVDLGARWITSGDGLAQFDAHIAAQKEKKRKEAEAKLAREEAAAVRQREREARGPTDEFRGSLSTMRKDDLKEIATALELPLTDANGKQFSAKVLMADIKAHFETHPEKKTWTRFRGLFAGRGGQLRSDGGPQTAPPQQSHERENVCPLQPPSFPSHVNHFAGPSAQ